MIWYLLPVLDSNLFHVSVSILRVPDVKSVSKSLSNDGYQMELHNKTMKNVPLTPTITVTNSPPNTTVGPDPTHYRMHCASWTALNDLMEMPQASCWTAMYKIKPQRQTLKDRNTWFLWKAFVSKKANHFIFVLSPSEKEDENYNLQCMDYQRLRPDNIFIISIPPIPDFLLTVFYH